VVILGLVIGFAIHQQQQRQQLLEQIAQRFHGRAEAGTWLAPPQVRLRFQNQPAVLKFTKVGKHSHHTNFLINWPDRGLRCEIYPEDILGGFRKLLGVEDIEIGSPQFDAAFIINANSRAAARELLTPDVQGTIFRLAALEPGGYAAGLRRGVQVKWGGGLLTVTKPCYLSSYGALEQFVSLSGQLYVAAVASRTSGIEFIGEVQEPDAVESQCQVCGEPLAQDLVYCASCHTPHHRECWEYFGGCSTYACGQKRYVQRTPKRRKAS
jgi:Prokaryotic RING finger family 1